MSDDASTIASYVASEDWDAFASDVFSGKDNIVGSAFADHIRGFFGADRLSGGKGADIMHGDAGADTMAGGKGDDAFYYNEASDSTGVLFDTVKGFNTAADAFGLTRPVHDIEDPIHNGTLRPNHFDTDLAAQIGPGDLSVNGALLLDVDGGAYDGRTFLIVNFNGTAGYQAGKELVIDVTGMSGNLGLDNFEVV
jgi:hypothetical protein